MITILFLGDISGKGGRRAIRKALPLLKRKHSPDLIIANIENLAHHKGVTKRSLNELQQIGCHAYTSGNHIWAKPEGVEMLDDPKYKILRPANYPEGAPGQGARIIKQKGKNILLINLLGRVFMHEDAEDPFRACDKILEEYADKKIDAIIVDFHAETTSEKVALSQYLDGRVSAVLGTHTHVPTADARIMRGKTAAITDVGMCGSHHSVLGVESEIIIDKFLHQRPRRHEPAEDYPYEIGAVKLVINTKNRRAEKIEAIRMIIEKGDKLA